MHYIQRKILDKLIYSARLRYSELKPSGIESNHFSYHLKQMMRDKLVEKVDKYYQLSAHGKAYVDTISYKTLEYRVQPKIITLLDITNKQGQSILYRRKNQPYIGMVGYPSGKVHLGETITEAAHREAEDKLGLKKLKLTHRGMVYVAISEKGQLISQVLAHVFEGSYNKDLPKAENVRATAFWDIPEEAAQREKFIPGYFDIKQLLQQRELFFREFEFEL